MHEVCNRIRAAKGPSAVGRRVASHQVAIRGLVDRQDRDSRTRALVSVDDYQDCLCGQCAPGLPSRTPNSLGMPFGLTTPGGQPVPV
jgi:hypothetical protein